MSASLGRSVIPSDEICSIQASETGGALSCRHDLQITHYFKQLPKRGRAMSYMDDAQYSLRCALRAYLYVFLRHPQWHDACFPVIFNVFPILAVKGGNAAKH